MSERGVWRMIRAVTTDDIAALVDLNRAIQRLHVEAERERFTVPSRGAVEAWFADRFRDENWQALVADVDGRCAGYLLFERVDRGPGTFTTASRTVYVHQLGVDTDFRRRGIGRALLKAVEDEAIAWGADQVALDTWSFNETARAFFAACGYEIYNLRLRRRVNRQQGHVDS